MTIEEFGLRGCVPCKGSLPMTRPDAEQVLRMLPGRALGDNSIEKKFRFGSSGTGLNSRTGWVGLQAQDHHRDMVIRWRRVRLAFTTRVIKGLSMNDFIRAAKAELQYGKYRSAGLRVTS